MGSTTVRDERGVVRRMLLAAVVADEDIDPEEIATVGRVYARITGRTVPHDDLRHEAAQLLAEQHPGHALARGVDVGLTDHDKQRVFAAAFAVVAADGFVLDEEEAMLATVARHLGLTPHDYQRMLASLMSDSPSG